jgi:hypothetical protein
MSGARGQTSRNRAVAAPAAARRRKRQATAQEPTAEVETEGWLVRAAA